MLFEQIMYDVKSGRSVCGNTSIAYNTLIQ